MRLGSLLGIVCAGLVVWLASVLSASAAVRNVVVIYDERTALPGLAAIDASIVSTLSEESPEPVQVYSEGMDLSRFGSETHMANFREYLRTKYADRKIDVAIAVLGPSLDFLLSYGQTIFPGADVVFCAVGRVQPSGVANADLVHRGDRVPDTTDKEHLFSLG
jgi:hypothetical protein